MRNEAFLQIAPKPAYGLAFEYLIIIAFINNKYFNIRIVKSVDNSVFKCTHVAARFLSNG